MAKRRRDGVKIVALERALPELEANGLLPEDVPRISDAEAEKADCVACLPFGSHSPFSDNVFTTCHDCGTGIFHRPYAPKLPKKLCIRCAMGRIRGAH